MKVTGFLNETYQTTLTIDGFEYVADRPIADGGTNAATTPHGMLLGSIAACKLMVAKGYLDYNNISYQQVRVEAESTIRGNKRNETIEVSIYIRVDGANISDKDNQYMQRIVEKGCTIANILTAGGENKVYTVVET